MRSVSTALVLALVFALACDSRGPVPVGTDGAGGGGGIGAGGSGAGGDGRGGGAASGGRGGAPVDAAADSSDARDAGEAGGCPASIPASGTSCTGWSRCTYGQITCCGVSYPTS